MAEFLTRVVENLSVLEVNYFKYLVIKIPYFQLSIIQFLRFCILM